MVIQLLCNTYNEIDVTCILFLVFRKTGNEAERRTHAPYLPLSFIWMSPPTVLHYINPISAQHNAMRSRLAIVTATAAIAHVWGHTKWKEHRESERSECSKQLCPLVRLSISVSHAISKPVTCAHTAFRMAYSSAACRLASYVARSESRIRIGSFI